MLSLRNGWTVTVFVNDSGQLIVRPTNADGPEVMSTLAARLQNGGSEMMFTTHRIETAKRNPNAVCPVCYGMSLSMRGVMKIEAEELYTDGQVQATNTGKKIEWYKYVVCICETCGHEWSFIGDQK